MSRFTLLHEVACQNRLGEGVQWNEHDQSVWWTDIQSSLIYRFTPASDQLASWPTPERISCFAFSSSDSRLLVAAAGGIAWLTLETGQLEWLARPEQHIRGNRMNDGRVDRQGRFWVGGLVEEKSSPQQTTSLYSFDGSDIICQLNDLTISNALCWNREGTRLYHADSPSGKIMQYPFDPITGRINGAGQVFVTAEAGLEPDGACIDSEDCLWNALWGSGQVRRYSPDGQQLVALDLPFTQPTCVAFGGPELSWLIVTSATQGLDETALREQPRAGNLLIYQTDIRGLPEQCFK
jgi:L-arabinonolactonase